jgi:hypothetical protein
VKQAADRLRRTPDVELLGYPERPSRPKPLPKLLVVRQRRDPGGELGPVGGGEQQPRLSVGDQFRDPGHSRRDDRLAECHRLHEHDWQPFHEARQDKGIAAGDLGQGLRFGQSPEEGDAVAQPKLFDAGIKLRPHRPITHDRQPRTLRLTQHCQSLEQAANALFW